VRTVRLHHPEPLASGGEVSIGEDDARYLTRVLRLPVGAPVVLFDGRGGEYEATIASAGRRRVVLAVGTHRPVECESALAITVAQGISRGERMDHVVQKTTELGAAAIVPLVCERGVVRLDEKRAAARLEHWQRVAAGACRQCGRNRLPRIAPITALGRRLTDIEPAGAGMAGPVVLLVGPEGGLTEQEAMAASDAGFLPIRLGPRVLRTETAAVAGVTALQTLWGDL
jgi:16S rRNA (uracil1498-N3)-methyltransferase